MIMWFSQLHSPRTLVSTHQRSLENLARVLLLFCMCDGAKETREGRAKIANIQPLSHCISEMVEASARVTVEN